jgi:hypothetical protein
MKELSIICTEKYYFSRYVPSTHQGKITESSKIEEARLFKRPKLTYCIFNSIRSIRGGRGPVCNLFWLVKTRNAEEEIDILPFAPYF